MSEDKVSFGYRTVGAKEKKRLVHDQFTPIAGTYDRGLGEIFRVLKPGGQLSALEFSLPRRRWQRALYSFYSFRIMLPAACLITGTDGPFRYLAESIRVFEPPEEVASRLGRVGFTGVAARPLSLGIASIYTGRKPEEAAHAQDRS